MSKVPEPVLSMVSPQGNIEVVIDHFPFTIGRHADQDLVLPYHSVSRQHAQIESDGLDLFLINHDSSTGTFVNGRLIERQRLVDNDLIRIGSSKHAEMRFRTQSLEVDPGSDLRTLLSQISHAKEEDLSLERLNWIVAAARRLNELGGVQEILAVLIDTSLALTGAERGYVFLRAASGELSLAAGRDYQHRVLDSDATISHTTIERSLESGLQFIVSDTLSEGIGMPSNSMVAHSLRAIICIPLRKITHPGKTEPAELLGVLYLDSRKERDTLTEIDNNLLQLVATEAAVLVRNATLALAEEEGRRYQEELAIASEIQRGLMRVSLPDLGFARVDASSIPCKGIGGDFYDVVSTDAGVSIVVADVSGKGVSAAILGSTLQGLIYSQLLAGLPLAQIALFTNQFLCHKNVGKYATLVILQIHPDGWLEYINCGHVQPLIQSGQALIPLPNCNLPVGLVLSATYTAGSAELRSGDRILIATDGVTEPENTKGVAYGEDRLSKLVLAGAEVSAILEDITSFTENAPLLDDCTLLEVCYRGVAAGE